MWKSGGIMRHILWSKMGVPRGNSLPSLRVLRENAAIFFEILM